MSKNGKKVVKLAQYKDMEDCVHSGYAPIYMFIIEQMRSDHFDKIYTLFNTQMTGLAKLLKEIYKLFPNFEDLTDEEKITFTEELSKNIEDEK